MSEDERFQDTGIYLNAYLDLMLVECPICHTCAKIVSMSNADTHLYPRLGSRLICGQCGLLQEKVKHNWQWKDGQDPIFELPLWLSMPCAGQTLWAFNEKHLAFLEDYVRATQREKFRDEQGWRSTSLASSLPEWMIVAKHREEVLRAIEKLKKRL